MVDITDEELAAAEERGRVAQDREPRATSVYYDRKSGLIVIELKYTSTLSFPARLLQGLENATDDEISEVEVMSGGYGLEWEKLDLHHAVPALAAGHYGTRKYMAGLIQRGVVRAYGDHGADHRTTLKKAAG